MISSISSFKIINVLIPESKNFIWITLLVADVAAFNPNGIKTFLANGLSISFVKGKPVCRIGHRNLPEIPPHIPILWNWVFDNFILGDELFRRALRILDIFVLVIHNVCQSIIIRMTIISNDI